MDEQIIEFLHQPAPAVLITYRKDGSAAASPVWFRMQGDRLEVVMPTGDVKLGHLARNPRCSLLVFEAQPPFRAVRVEGEPTLHDDGATGALLAIASRYLGEDVARPYADRFARERGPGVLLSLPLEPARTWDLAHLMP
jgi:PPOX class probable F420-dependent enzyme